MTNYKGMVDAKEIGTDISKFLKNYGTVSMEFNELQAQIELAFDKQNVTVTFLPQQLANKSKNNKGEIR